MSDNVALHYIPHISIYINSNEYSLYLKHHILQFLSLLELTWGRCGEILNFRAGQRGNRVTPL